MITLSLIIFKTQNALSLIDLNKVIPMLICLCTLLSCSDVQKREKPENLISKDKMVEIYTDMIFLDAIQRSRSKEFKTYELTSSEHILNKYNIDSTTLSQNMLYYNLDFEANAAIYDQVKQNITERDKVLDSITTLRDSLKKLETEKKKNAIKDSTQPKKNIKKQLKIKDP